MNLPLRVPDHGPYVTSDAGGQATPGTGFQTRYAAFIATDVLARATANNATPLTTGFPSLASVQTNLRYRPELLMWLTKTDSWTSTGTVAWTFQYSADAGVTYTTWVTQTVTYGGEAAHDISENVTEKIQPLATLGSALTGVADGDTLQLRVLGVLAGGVDGAIEFRSTVDARIALIEEL
jgi:hypothetical protein